MPRNGSGTMVRPGGATAWTDDRNAGTKITADLHDTHDEDIATEISNSLAKDGQTTATAMIPLAAGVSSMVGGVGTPSFTFTSDTNTGIYRPGADTLGITCGGVLLATFATARIELGSLSTHPTQINSKSITKPNAPMFLAYNSSTDANVTGNGTVATVDFDTEVFDRGGDFASDTFTAPVTGIYQFSGVVRLTEQVAGTTSVIIRAVTSNNTYVLFEDTASTTGTASYPWVLSATDMDAADTVTITVTCSGNGSDNVDIVGSAARVTHFAGALIG